EVPHAPVVERDDLPRLRAGLDVDGLGAVQRLDGHAGAERRRRHRDLDRAVQVVALPLEDRVRPFHDLQEQVAGRPAAGADLALAGELDVDAVLHPGGDLDLHGAPGADPPVARALGARVADHRAETAARRARPGRHDLAEERALHLLHLAAAVTGVAGLGVGAGGASGPLAVGADDGGVDGQLARRAERRLVEVELHPQGRVPAAPRAGPGAAGGPGAEEGVHDVAEREPRAAEAAGARTAPGRERVRAEVVHLALLRVGEHLVGLGDLLEPVLGLRIRVDVRVELPREPAVG